MAAEEQRRETAAVADAAEAEEVYKTKVVHFLGRATPIILQNDNGPCPLLAICNVLLLRNTLNLSLDASEVSQQKLLSLVAERLIDSNSNVQDKDDGYVSNQQQNIADAIDLLPRLATGIDVNLHFKKINDFEFTRECAIFDLLDIGLYHGWIVDPQDTDTAAAIGSKSYNTLVAELVAFETRKSEIKDRGTLEEDYVDFAAATTATLGVPSPSLSKGKSFDDCPVSIPVEQRKKKGDMEEEEELMRALNLSKTEVSSPVDVSMQPVADWSTSSPSLEESANVQGFLSGTPANFLEAQTGIEPAKSYQLDLHNNAQECNSASDCKDDSFHSRVLSIEDNSLLPKNNVGNDIDQSVSEGAGKFLASSDSMEDDNTVTSMQSQGPLLQSPDEESADRHCTEQSQVIVSGEDQSDTKVSTGEKTSQINHMLNDKLIDSDSTNYSGPTALFADFHSPNEREELSDVSEVVTSSLEGSEPIYEGEEHILDSGVSTYENREPVYEGEVVLAKQVDKMEGDVFPINLKHEAARQQWQLIKNFLENNANQLTVYGLFCLQEGLKERELCVFFRNNHFSTMFKYNGELYLLATDQGYINQPDLVWEKLNEVNGDTVFMTGNFMEFKAESQVNSSWNEQNVMTSTADYLATLESSTSSTSALNSDLQLAIALQQQEFEQQPQRQQQQSQRQQQQYPPQSSVTGRSRLVIGPQGPRSSSAPQKTESKAKDKCIVM